MRSSLPIVSPTVSQQAMSSPRPCPQQTRRAETNTHTSSRSPPPPAPFHNSTATCP
ncbi:hypothetical protein LX32DRAFT_397720 [Colletotrichum zoysiae]|uniref:Uncharacterized protein n=1 Tax=Colletotrichum zoysiae TaxID=1216348 RepID=A0AAD9M5W0_9PEZI|nr:hypothetical protein LX32DRAFT_397720 [Colletotrichum zoysiae]